MIVNCVLPIALPIAKLVNPIGGLTYRQIVSPLRPAGPRIAHPRLDPVRANPLPGQRQAQAASGHAGRNTGSGVNY